MSRLGARISVLLTLAILFVVGAATALVLALMKPPPAGRPDESYRVATRLALFAQTATSLQPDDWRRLVGPEARIGAAPPAAPTDERRSADLAEALATKGVAGEARVTRPEGGDRPTAALRLADGRWLSMVADGRPEGPPPHAWMAFAFWLALISLGTAGLVVFAVMRATRPLAALERAAAEIGRQGDFVELPETGPAEVRAATRAVNELSRRLGAAMESRMRLVAAAGHDLRTPMTRMRLRAEFLGPEAEREKWLADLDELDRIADSAIRLVREEVDPDAHETIEIDVMAREIAAELAEIGLSVRVARTTPAVTVARPTAMRRALRNLFVNAATHGASAVVAVETRSDRVAVIVEDEGPGIPPELIERAFEPFFRVDPARSSPIAGAGLGLAIAKEIVTRNGGDLTLANRPAGGLIQVVTLPAAPTSSASQVNAGRR